MIKIWGIKRFVSKIAGSSNGRTTDSESVNLGSNPSPAVLKRSKETLHPSLAVKFSTVSWRPGRVILRSPLQITSLGCPKNIRAEGALFDVCANRLLKR